LDENRAVTLNAKPQNTTKHQVRLHFVGKRQAKPMKRFGATSLLSEDNLGRFFGEILGQPTPSFSKTNTPAIVLKNYIAQHNGDADWAMQYYAPPPPPLPEEDWLFHPKRKARCVEVKRRILSPLHATWRGKGWAKMLCCWDDNKSRSTIHGCQRPNCGYTHATVFLAANAAGVVTDDDWYALFKILPCTMAGMPGGCKFHRASFDGWDIPKLQVAQKPEEPLDFSPIHYLPDEEQELMPCYMDGSWVLQRKLYIRSATESYRSFLNDQNLPD